MWVTEYTNYVTEYSNKKHLQWHLWDLMAMFIIQIIEHVNRKLYKKINDCCLKLYYYSFFLFSMNRYFKYKGCN